MFDEYLESFLTIVRLKTYAAAADRLFVSQSTLSRQITHLEAIFGKPLFVRNNRVVKLTKAGAVLAEEAPKLLHEIHELKRKISLAERDDVGQIVVSFPSHYSGPVLDAIRIFISEHLNVATIFESYENGKLSKIVSRMDSDLIIANSFELNIELDLLGWEVSSLLRDRCVLVVGAAHPLARKSSVNSSEITGESVFIGYRFLETPYPEIIRCLRNPDMGNTLYYLGDKEMFDRADSSTLLLFVQSGLGVTIAPLSTLEPKSDSYCCLDIADIDAGFDICALWRKENSNPMFSALRKTVEEKFGIK